MFEEIDIERIVNCLCYGYVIMIGKLKSGIFIVLPSIQQLMMALGWLVQIAFFALLWVSYVYWSQASNNRSDWSKECNGHSDWSNGRKRRKVRIVIEEVGFV